MYYLVDFIWIGRVHQKPDKQTKLYSRFLTGGTPHPWVHFLHPSEYSWLHKVAMSNFNSASPYIKIGYFICSDASFLDTCFISDLNGYPVAPYDLSSTVARISQYINKTFYGKSFYYM